MSATAQPQPVRLPDSRARRLDSRRRPEGRCARARAADRPREVADLLTRDELGALPTVLDVPTAARVLGIGRTMAYELVRTGTWPSPVLRVGRLVKIPTASLLAVLGEKRP
jgi:predicted DNA-binding transcriptional regulator AlpA